jgi:predicted nucleic acid-binding protein
MLLDLTLTTEHELIEAIARRNVKLFVPELVVASLLVVRHVARYYTIHAHCAICKNIECFLPIRIPSRADLVVALTVLSCGAEAYTTTKTPANLRVSDAYLVQ